MGWDENLFHWFLKATQRLSGKSEDHPNFEFAARLESLHPRLKLLASALADETMEVKEAETHGGILGNTLLLPPVVSLLPNDEDNAEIYIYRVAYSVTLVKLGVFLPSDFEGSIDLQNILAILVTPWVRKHLIENYPTLAEIERRIFGIEFERVSSAQDHKGSKASCLNELLAQALKGELEMLMPSEAIAEAKTIYAGWVKLSGFPKFSFPPFFSLPYPQCADKEKGAVRSPNIPVGSLASGTEKKGKAREKLEEVKFSQDKLNESPLVHVFEKVKTADEYLGGRKALDGEDEMRDHHEALSELDLKKIIRSSDRTQSIFKSDVIMESIVGDLEEGINTPEEVDFLYDEWNEKNRTYKKDWCRIRVSPAQHRVSAEQANEYVSSALTKHVRQIRELRQEFEKIKAERKWRNRQLDGSEIDIDSVVDRHATLRSGHSPSDALYLSRRRHERDFATLVLLDSSLSTDSWIQNHRVMDVLKESMIVLGKVVSEFQDKVAIAGFHSNTRNDCRFFAIKDFEESWDLIWPKLVSLQPTGYTRIGPALRHAIHMLSNVSAKKKLILLISDGKPTDFDRYEGKYGVSDIRQAIREATGKQITVRALAIDSNAKFYLPEMFGSGNFQILPHPGRLTQSIAELYGWLMK